MVNLHLFFLALSAAVVVVADEHAFSWMLGRTARLSEKRLTILHYLTWFGLVGLINTGFLLLLPMWTYALSLPLFQIKLLLVPVLVLNAILIGRLMPVATTKTFGELTLHERAPLIISGAISTASWLTIAAIGFWLFW